MDVKCSFSGIAGGPCTTDRRDRSKNTQVIPLSLCTKEIAGHKSMWKIPDVETEVELILARAAIFKIPENFAQLTICLYHRSSLGTGWCRGSQRCKVPHETSKHNARAKKWPKAERGLGLRSSRLIHQRTGVFVTVGSGMH